MNISRNLLAKLGVLALVCIIMASCSSSNDVAQNGLFQKRKYRQGFHFNGLSSKSSIHNSDAKTGIASANPAERNEEIAIEAPAAKQERKEERPEEYALGNDEKLQQLEKSQSGSKLKPLAFETLGKIRETKSEIRELLNGPGFETQETGSEGDETTSMLALIFGIAAWFFALLGLAVPFVGILGLACAIVGFILGKKNKDVSSMAKIGYMLSLIYLIVALVTLVIALLLLIIVIIILGASL